MLLNNHDMVLKDFFMLLMLFMGYATVENAENSYHGDEPYRILVVQNRILFVISGFYLCKRVFVGRGKYPENHM